LFHLTAVNRNMTMAAKESVVVFVILPVHRWSVM